MTVMGTGRRKPPGQGSGLTRGLQAGAVRQGGDEESPARTAQGSARGWRDSANSMAAERGFGLSRSEHGWDVPVKGLTRFVRIYFLLK